MIIWNSAFPLFIWQTIYLLYSFDKIVFLNTSMRLTRLWCFKFFNIRISLRAIFFIRGSSSLSTNFWNNHICNVCNFYLFVTFTFFNEIKKYVLALLNEAFLHILFGYCITRSAVQCCLDKSFWFWWLFDLLTDWHQYLIRCTIKHLRENSL